MTTEPYFSIIIPAYNRASLIETTLQSVFDQTMQNYELILIDDGSTDETAEVALKFAAKFSQPCRVLRQANAGPGAARNTGIAHATGQYVAFLDSDDVWFPWTLNTFHHAIAQHDQPAFVCGVPIDVRSEQPIHADGNRRPSFEAHADFYSVPDNPFHRFTTSGVCVRKSSLDKVNGFATGGFEDLDLWMRLGTETGFLIILEPPVVVRRLLGSNLSESRKYNQSGTTGMIASEKTGQYPGGSARRNDRRRLLGVLMRNASLQMLKSGDRAAGRRIYQQIFWWSVIQLRFRYLLGFPLRALAQRGINET